MKFENGELLPHGHHTERTLLMSQISKMVFAHGYEPLVMVNLE